MEIVIIKAEKKMGLTGSKLRNWLLERSAKVSWVVSSQRPGNTKFNVFSANSPDINEGELNEDVLEARPELGSL